MRLSTYTLFAVLALAVSLVVLAYWRGLSGPFLFDDFYNLEPIALFGGVSNWVDVLRYMFASDGLEWRRALVRLTFLFNDQFWPSEPQPFKKFNLALHLVNALLLVLLLIRLHSGFARQPLSAYFILLVAVMWLVAPMHVSTVLYVVQRMTLLATSFSLICLLFYVVALQAEHNVWRYLWLVSSFFAALLAMLCKENSAVLLLLIPIVSRLVGKVKIALPWWWAVGIRCLPWLFLTIFFAAAFVTWPHYLGRVFGPMERLLMQGPILVEYMFQFVWVFDSYTVFHDDKEFIVDNMPIAICFIAWAFHLAAIGAALKYWSKDPFLCAGVLWFYAAHTIESSIIPLELMFEHRNYFPAIGLVLALGRLLFLFAVSVSIRFKSAFIGAALILLPVLLSVIALMYQANIWSDYRILASKWAADNPNSLRSQMSFVGMLQSNGFELMALNKLEEIQQQFSDPAIDLRMMYLACLIGDSRGQVNLAALARSPFSSGVLHELSVIVKSVSSACVREKADSTISGLAGAIEGMPLLSGKASYFARYYDIASGAYIRDGDYSSAVKAREGAWKLQPTVATAQKLAEVYIAGGDKASAQYYVDQAFALDSRRWFQDERVLAGIESMQNLIDSMPNRE